MEPIAIIGIACLLPGAKTPAEFWQNLLENRTTVTSATMAEMGVDPLHFYDPDKGKPDHYYWRSGGYIRDFHFDPTGYALPATTLAGLDDTHKWALYVAREALRDSGYGHDKAALAECGLILGSLSFPTKSSRRFFDGLYRQAMEPHLQRLFEQPLSLPALSAAVPPAPSHALLAGHPAAVVAQALSLSQLHFTLDAACASSLYAMKFACDALQTGKANLMLAGAVSSADPLFIQMGFSIFQAYPHPSSPQAQSRPLDQSSGGLTAGEGAAIFVLKRYADAVRDHDQIYALIGGVGLSNDGRGKFLLSPQAKGQLLAYERAYRAADISPADVAYVECHATGTPLGDKTELAALDSFWGKADATPLVGAVKANVGHLLTVAGMAGMLKVILSMRHGLIPATPQITNPLQSPNGVIGAEQIVCANTPWPTTLPKVAAVNAFGFGGANAHLILAEPAPVAAENAAMPRAVGSRRSAFAGDAEHLSYVSPQGVVAGREATPLAIVGMGAFFAGCPDLHSFARTIYGGQQHFVPLPPQRWKGIDRQPTLRQALGLSADEVLHGAFLTGFEFDFLNFGIPPLADDQPIPQQLLLLKVVAQALDDAALAEQKNVAVIVAMGTELALHQYLGRCDLTWQLPAALQQQGLTLTSAEIEALTKLAKDTLHHPASVVQYTSFIGNILAGRVAAHWDFSGPAFTISAEENSAMRAIEAAELLLAAGEVDAVVVAAVALSGSAEDLMVRQQLFPLNTGQPGLSYGVGVNGWSLGEGAGAVVLQRLDVAQRVQARTYAVIESLAFAQGSEIGEPVEPLVFHPSATTVQQAALRALQIAGRLPSAVDYLELCGSGIEAQDQAELAGLQTVYQGGQAQSHWALGSVKANIGHTFAASGLAGLIKTALCLHHRFIPATAAWSQPKQADEWGNAFYVPTASLPWLIDESGNTSAGRRVAAISGLGIDGVCSHLILAEAATTHVVQNDFLTHTPPYLFLLVADDQPQLLAEIRSLQARLAEADSLVTLAQQQWQIAQRQPRAAYALVLVGATSATLTQEIESALPGVATAFAAGGEWQSVAGSYFTAAPLGPQAKIAYVYPGAFTVYGGLGRELFQLFPHLFDQLTALVPDLGHALTAQQLYPHSQHALSKAEMIAMDAQMRRNTPAMLETGIAFAWFYTRIVQDLFKLRPQMALGYSLGESTMLYALEAWTLAANNRAALRTSSLFQNRLSGRKDAVRAEWGLPPALPGKDEEIWRIYLLKAPVTAVQAAIQQADRVYLTHINTANEVVIAGDPTNCQRVIATLACDWLPAPFTDVLHWAAMRSAYPEFVALNTLPITPPSGIEFSFAVDSAPSPVESTNVAHKIATALCQPVDFPRQIERVYAEGARIFVELGAHNSCTRWIGEIMGKRAHLAVAINQRGLSDRVSLLRLVGQLFSHRVDLDLTPLFGDGLPAGTTQHASRSLVKTVTLGGTPIGEALLDGSHLTGVNHAPPIVWDEQALLEFAGGKLANVFGPEYAIIDSYARRVRLPLPPYLLVSRVTKLAAQRGHYEPAQIETEYDIPSQAWYTVDGQAPVAVTVEAGQCDLLLISYIGIDFENKGNLVYRLLDCTLTFLAPLPIAGQTLRYSIHIDSYTRSGENLLFFFHYDCYADDKLILQMRNGCAGFFSDADLAQGKGIVVSDRERAARDKIKPQTFHPLLACEKTVFTQEALLALSQGDLASCFGIAHAQAALNPSLRYPDAKLLMIDRITSVAAQGGAWGLGLLTAEKELAPDHWYFPCHFQDDPVLAGSLIAEGCVQLLQFYMLYLGLHTLTTDAHFQPILDLAQHVRCRGQVTPNDQRIVYRLEITALGLSPTPYAQANVDVLLGDKIIVNFQNVGVRLVEKQANPLPGKREEDSVDSEFLAPLPARPSPPLFTEYHLREFALGDIANCFGPEYAIYRTRQTSRTPNGDLQLISRILEIEGERHHFDPNATLLSAYDVPINPWFGAQQSIPYAILMELGLQPCGFLSAWLGSSLLFPNEELYFRNLDGHGRLLRTVAISGKTITNQVRLRSSTVLQGIIIQTYSFELAYDSDPFYVGEATFGYFTATTLQKQVGLDGGKQTSPWYEQGASTETTPLTPSHPFFSAMPEKPFYRLANGQLNFLDDYLVVANGGKHGKGYVYASKRVDPQSWFFACHFYQDPVMPGSLGVEAVLQAMQIFALQQDWGRAFQSPRFTQRSDQQTVWKYRGQITPQAQQMALEVHLTQIEVEPTRVTLYADANLWKDGLRIYAVEQIALSIEETASLSISVSINEDEPMPSNLITVDLPQHQNGYHLQPSQPPLLFDPAAIRAALLDLAQPCYLVRQDGRFGVSLSNQASDLVGMIPAITPPQLGDPLFRAFHQVEMAYASGAMANGIASEELVSTMGRAGLLSSFGAAGLLPERVEQAIAQIQQVLPQGPYAFNLIHSPSEEALERAMVDRYLRHGVTTVEASAFLDLTPHIVCYRAAGLALDAANQITIKNKIIAKVSRREVAQKFLQPPPPHLLAELVAQGRISELQATLAQRVPMADDLTVEADSGGHTDNRPLVSLLPALIDLRDEMQTQFNFVTPVRVGAAGGISTPAAVAAAFMLGAAYVVTGSINQACVEAGASAHTKRLLAQTEMADVMMAPAADMFELGVKVQVLKRGTFFPLRAQKLYELYRTYDSLDAIPLAERQKIEQQIFGRPLEAVWSATQSYFAQRDPEQIARAEQHPKRKMALIFRWYLGLSSRWSNIGEKGREEDYQIWCGPSMGAFNDWTRGTYLAEPDNRKVVEIAHHLMTGAAFLTRLHYATLLGLNLPSAYRHYRPAPLPRNR